MSTPAFSRRDALKFGGLTAALTPALTAAPDQAAAAADTDRERRMLWWHEARFGMFIHWGLYSTLGRHEWAMEEEGIPVTEYEKQAYAFKPKPNAATRDRQSYQLAPVAAQPKSSKNWRLDRSHLGGAINSDQLMLRRSAESLVRSGWPVEQ